MPNRITKLTDYVFTQLGLICNTVESLKFKCVIIVILLIGIAKKRGINRKIEKDRFQTSRGFSRGGIKATTNFYNATTNMFFFFGNAGCSGIACTHLELIPTTPSRLPRDKHVLRSFLPLSLILSLALACFLRALSLSN